VAQTVGVIQQFLHPPVGLLSRSVIVGSPFSDYHLFTRTVGPIGVFAFGIAWALDTWPAGYGREGGVISNMFDRDVLKMTVFHRLADGSDVRTEEVRTRLQASYILFSESFPFSVATELSPGVTATFYWLLLGP
jgi:hypothetical protein